MSQDNTQKYVHVNRRMGTIELNLPDKYNHLNEEIRQEVKERFSFEMIDTLLEEDIQRFVEDYINGKENQKETNS